MKKEEGRGEWRRTKEEENWDGRNRRGMERIKEKEGRR